VAIQSIFISFFSNRSAPLSWIPSHRCRRRQPNPPPPPITLPYEIITDILSRLTVKQLMKMKCMSKSWKTLISSDPIFINLHFNRSEKNTFFSLASYEYNTTIQNDEYSFVPFPVTSLLQNRCINIPNNPCFQLNNKNCHEVVGSCNGLVCLLGYSKEKKTVMWLRFWNPATRALSDKLGYLYDVKYHWNSWRFVFCYDSSNDIYKVVALHNKGSNSSPEVSVFSLGDNVWRDIESFPVVPLQFFNMSPFRVIDPQPKLWVNPILLMIHVKMVCWKRLIGATSSLIVVFTIVKTLINGALEVYLVFFGKISGNLSLLSNCVVLQFYSCFFEGKWKSHTLHE